MRLIRLKHLALTLDLSPANTYTVLLKEGGKQIDIFEFTNTTRLSL